MIEAWKKQFTLKQLSLTHDKPITFITCQWQKQPIPNIFYLVYRWIVAIIFFVTLAIGIIDLKHPNASALFRAKWLIYLTNWGYTVCTLQALVSAVILSLCILAPYLRSMPNFQEKTLKCYKLYWLTNVIATDIAFGITVLYWSLIYDEKTMEFDAMNYFVHANNSVLMMIDLFVVAHPIRLLHCCYPVVFGVCYALFSVIFYAAGGISREGQIYIYYILNWSKPGLTTVVCIGVTGFIVVVHIVAWGLYKFRLWIHSKYAVNKEEDCGLNNDEKDFSKMGGYLNEIRFASDVV